MDHPNANERRHLEEKYGGMMKTMTMYGFGAGTIFGWAIATLRVESNVSLPRDITTLKVVRHCGLMFVAYSGVYFGVSQLVEKYRGKEDSYNTAICSFVAGASIIGLSARSIPTGICSGAICAMTSVFFDSQSPEENS